MGTKEKELRTIKVLREVETTMGELKKGDIFRMEPASNFDTHCDRTQFQYCTKDAEYDEEEKIHRVQAEQMNFVKATSIFEVNL